MLGPTRFQRQVVATLVMLGLFVVPTGLVVAWAWEIRRPEHRRRVEGELGSALGMDVSIGRVRYPRPKEMWLEGVALAPPGEAVGPSALVKATGVRIVRRPEGTSIETRGLTVRPRGARDAVARLGGLLTRVRGTGAVHLIATECVVEAGAGRVRTRIRDLVGTVRPDAVRPMLSASFRLDGGGTRCEATVVRDGRDAEARTTVTLQTTDTGTVPASALDALAGVSAWLGGEARVGGELALEQVGTGDWAARLRGHLEGVDLALLLGRLTREAGMTGRARIVVEEARWGDLPGRGPGWTAGRGVLTAGPGTIGEALLRSLSGELGFGGGDRAEAVGPDREYRELGLRFAFDESGRLELAGGLGPEQRAGGVMVSSGRGAPLLTAPAGASDLTALVRALAPEALLGADRLIPARFESLVIQRYLPAPGDGAGVRRAGGPE